MRGADLGWGGGVGACVEGGGRGGVAEVGDADELRVQVHLVPVRPRPHLHLCDAVR